MGRIPPFPYIPLAKDQLLQPRRDLCAFLLGLRQVNSRLVQVDLATIPGDQKVGQECMPVPCRVAFILQETANKLNSTEESQASQTLLTQSIINVSFDRYCTHYRDWFERCHDDSTKL